MRAPDFFCALADADDCATESSVRVTDVPLGGVGDEVGQILGDSGPVPVGDDGDREGVFHLSHQTHSSSDVKWTFTRPATTTADGWSKQ